MGNTQSNPSLNLSRKRFSKKIKVIREEKKDSFIDEKYTQNDLGSLGNETLVEEDLNKFSQAFNGVPTNLLALNVVTNEDMGKILLSRQVTTTNIHVFSEKIELEGKVTNQKSSGRCWLFAATNVMRLLVMKKYNLQEFELSQPYLFFYDKLEKANFFLESMIQLANQDIESRLVQYLLQAPVNDGGQWDMVINLLEKYGVVPKTAFPESYNSSNSARLNWLVTAKLREFAYVLRDQSTSGKSQNSIRNTKLKMMEDIYRILAISLGEPPKEFDWTFRNKDGKYYEFKGLTPQSYFKDIVGYNAKDTFSLVNDPRNEYLKLYTVEYLGNVQGGLPIRYVNIPIEEMKRLAITVLRSGKPVWFGADVGKFSDYSLGILDNNIYDFELAFNVKFNLNKADRLRYGESLMTHAMVFTGVHLEDSRPTRWRVENSWGTDRGKEGYFVMSDGWFNDWVYQIVLEKQDAPKELFNVLQQEPHVLPAWDPMGSLATV